MIAIDPAVRAAWRQGAGTNRLRLVVDDPVAAWPALSDVFDEVVAASDNGTWSEAVVTPEGVLFRGAADDPDVTLGALVTRLGERGVQAGRLVVDDACDQQAAELRQLAARTAWIVAWLVPLKVKGLEVTFRAPREWRNRRFPVDLVRQLVATVVADVPDAAGHVMWSDGCFDLPAASLDQFAPCWMEHGITTAAVLGDVGPDAPDAPDAPDVPVLVTSMHRGSELLGVGTAGAGLADDPARAGAVLARLTDLVTSLAGDVAYAVVGVHETGAAAADGVPFREVVPATARVRHNALSLRSLDQWVLDAAPVQVLTRHHQVGERDGIVVHDLPADRRLVHIGTPDDWFSGPTRRAQIRNRGREALAPSLPPPKTPLPEPQV